MTGLWWLGNYQVKTKCHGCWACAPKAPKLYKRKTVQRENHWMGTGDSFQLSWLSATSKISLWLQSKAICHVKCAIFRRLHFGPIWQGQFVHWSAVCSSMKSTTEFECLPFAKGQSSDEGTHRSRDVLCENESAQWKLHLQIDFLVSSFAKVCTIRQERLGCCRSLLMSTTHFVKGDSGNLRVQEEYLPAALSWYSKNQR